MGRTVQGQHLRIDMNYATFIYRLLLNSKHERL